MVTEEKSASQSKEIIWAESGKRRFERRAESKERRTESGGDCEMNRGMNPHHAFDEIQYSYFSRSNLRAAG